MEKRKILINSCSVKKTGHSTSKKTGKPFKWTLWNVDCIVMPSEKAQTFSSFDDFNSYIGQEVEVEVEKSVKEVNGTTYENYQIKLPKQNIYETIRALEKRVEALEIGKEEKQLEEINTDELSF